MKQFQLNTKSWHYRLAAKYGPMAYRSPCKDICSYSRCVLWGTLIVVICSLITGSVMSIFFSDFLAWAVFCLIHEYVEISLGGLTGIILAGMFATIITSIILLINFPDSTFSRTVVSFFSTVGGYIARSSRPSKSSFLIEAYRRFKEKSCVEVKYY